MGVRRIGVFGSYVQGDARLGSDIDILVALTEPYSLLDVIGIKTYLEDLFKQEVDVSPEDSLKPGIRERVMGEVLYAEDV